MKKIILAVLIAVFGSGFIFSDGPFYQVGETDGASGSASDSLIVSCSVEGGNMPENEYLVAQNGGLYIVAQIILDTSYIDSSASLSKKENITTWSNDGIHLPSSANDETFPTISLLSMGDETAVRNFTVVFGAYGNVSASNLETTSMVINASSGGWKLGSNRTDDVNLFMETEGFAGEVFSGSSPEDCKIIVSTEAAKRQNDISVVGNLKVSWANDVDDLLLAGTYSTSIKLTFSPD